MIREEAARLLRLVLPTTTAAVKTAFRRRALEVHPDKSKAANAQEAFIVLQEALKALLEDAEVVTTVEAAAICDDGTSLSELGKGLGPLTNGRPCVECHGAGFKQYRMGTVSCSDCGPMFSSYWYGLRPSGWSWQCPRCKGSGKFVRNSKELGECFRCHGKGWIRTQENHCETCHGSGVDPRRGQVYYSRCTECKGTGEIQVLNPVLPKGLLAQRQEGGEHGG